MNKYTQHKGRQIAEQIKYEQEYEDSIKNFDLFTWLVSQGKESHVKQPE